MSDAATAVEPGHLYGVGLGPGDPGLITRRGADIIAAADVVAFHAGARPRGASPRSFSTPARTPPPKNSSSTR